jgi:hypothetical protein
MYNTDIKHAYDRNKFTDFEVERILNIFSVTLMVQKHGLTCSDIYTIYGSIYYKTNG